MTTGDILREASTRVRGNWGQRSMISDDGRICAAAAILGLTRRTMDWRETTYPEARRTAIHRFIEAVRLPEQLYNSAFYYMAKLPIAWSSKQAALAVYTEPLPIGPPPQLEQVLIDVNTVAHWNDAPGQTAEAIATALEFAAIITDHEDATRHARQDAGIEVAVCP